MKLYFLSTNGDLYNKIIEPRVPDNYATDIGMEDNQTKRIAVCDTIRGCLSSIPIVFNKGDTIYALPYKRCINNKIEEKEIKIESIVPYNNYDNNTIRIVSSYIKSIKIKKK